MELNSYKDTWNGRVNSLKSGAIAVDGSTDEETLLSNGEWTANQMQAALEIDADDVVLELGCGVARIGKLLAPRCKKWIGVDISENMLEIAAQRLDDLDNVEFHALARNDLRAIADNSVDKLYTVAVFCHLDKEDLFNYLREIHRVLKPGGCIYVETWNLASDVGWKRWLSEADNWLKSDHSLRKDVARNQFCSPDEFELYVTKAGFDILGSYGKSVWNQIVAGKSMAVDVADEKTKYLVRNVDNFIYSQSFTELFNFAMDVDHGSKHPKEMMAYLDSLGDVSEVPMFRRYMLGLWKNNEARWGKCPQ